MSFRYEWPWNLYRPVLWESAEYRPGQPIYIFFTEHTVCVCERIGHPFEDCEVFQNVEFLRKHHIQYCLQARHLRKLFDQQTKKNVALYLVDTVYGEDDVDDDAADQEEGQDFRQGEDK